MRSVDGTVYYITSRHAIDYVLHPEFLRFVIVTCVMYALLRGDADVPGLSGWPFLAVWALVFTVILLWLGLSGQILALLQQHGLIRQVWTPLLLLPLNLLIEASVQGAMFWLADQPLKSLGMTLSDLTRDFVVLLLLDLLHGHYVVARHPFAHIPGLQSDDASPTDAPDPAPPVTATSQNVASQPDTPRFTGYPREATEKSPIAGRDAQPALVAVEDAPPAVAPSKKVQIGTQTFALSDILMIRIEDHYLSVTTRSGRSMQRAKLRSIEALHKGDVGVQINRSVWVAFSAIREVQPTKNGQILLMLINGDEELVAKPRVYAFRQAYRVAVSEAA